MRIYSTLRGLFGRVNIKEEETWYAWEALRKKAQKSEAQKF